MTWYGHNLSYETTKKHYLEKLKFALGDHEFEKISHQVRSSNSLNKFFQRIQGNSEMPSQIVITSQIMQTRAFLFTTNYQKILAASIFLFDWWGSEAIMKKRIVSDAQLVENLERLVERVENISVGRM